MGSLDARAAAAESLAKGGRWREASEAYSELITAGRSDYFTHYNYGTVLMHCDRYEAARDQLCLALECRPDSLDVLNNLAAAYLKVCDPCAAEAACRLIIAQQPDHHLAWTNLGLSLNEQGRVPEGIAALQSALELVPDDPIVCENILMNLCYIATDGEDLAEVHQMLCAQIPSSPRKPLPDASGRRIRIGYLSCDFRNHSVSFFMAGPILAHDRSAFEVFCYSTTHAPDRKTEDFRQLSEHFVDLSPYSDPEAARRIEADGIDILVDLGGHTRGKRLGIFALRPAPVQVTYLGYPATTGCSFIDYRLVDALTDPEGSEAHATERLIRLPAPFLSYYPHSTFPESTPPPVLANGYITFGSFNNSSKISEDTLDLWSRVLTEVPASRMFIKAWVLANPAVCERFRGQFSQRGIDPARLTFSGFMDGDQGHLAAYSMVDIALDTFPYNGTTTTCEALWMGVPVISLVGSLHAARVGYTILTAVGLGGIAATSPDSYVALAAAFAENISQLASIRGQLQKAVAQSPLCDRFRLTRGLEDAYRGMLDPGE